MSQGPPTAPTAPRTDARAEPPPRLFGREELVDELAAPGGPVLTVLQADAGAGRSAVLDAVRERCAANGTRVLRLRAGEHDRLTQFGALYRLLSDLDGPDPEPGAGGVRSSVLGLVATLSAAPGSAHAPATAGQLAMAVFSAARRYLPLVVLVDDAQWLDDGTTAVLEPLVRRLSGQPCSVVLAVRPDPRRSAAAPVLERLRAAGLARVRTLRPLTAQHSRQLITEALRAQPDAALVAELHRASRGLPAALVSGIGGYQEAGALRVVDRHAYLLPTGRRPAVDERHPLLAPVREAGAHAWSVARAMSLFAAFGAPAPRLVAEALGCTEQEARDGIAALVRQRVLVRAGDGWRFRVPMVRRAVECCLGPYERRNLSALAVEAIWDGEDAPDDPFYLPDRLVDAGRLVDPQHSSQELLACGVQRMFDDRRHAASWLQAAAERVADPTTQATALLAHAAACTGQDLLEDAVRSARTLLDGYADAVPEQLLQQAVLAYLTAVASLGDRRELRRIADSPEPMPGGAAQQLVAKAFALGWLDRWGEGRRLLDAERETLAAGPPVVADHANIYRIGAAVMQGEVAELRAFVAEPERWRSTDVPETAFEVVRHEVNLLLALGELGPAEQLLERNGLRVDQLAYTDQFMVHFMRGEWHRAIDTARRSMAASVLKARPFGWAMLYMGAAQIHIEGGMLSRARFLIEEGREGPMPHLFDFSEAKVLHALGEHQEAGEQLAAGLRTAEEHGFVFGTEGMLAELAFHAHVHGDPHAAEQHLTRLGKLVEQLDTGRARLHLLVTRARLRGDRAAAEEAVRLVRERGQPYEMVVVFTRLARSGHRTGELLPEAYRLAGELQALQLRSRLRQVMRHHNVPVPSRGTTTAENERLLAVLVTEGLTNRQLAAVFGATEKSVEGRLTRMFARIGYRSRVELAAAMLTGEYPG